ncbi:SLC13 family permease [Streptomyces sp. IBSBF 2435]|uniref:SLC13 family permease n=1 Tax=Streptomyces sp. IBSBF 2435 TaxID=2903531 RepID=UPI003FA716A9
MDWFAGALLLCGLICVATGLLPIRTAEEATRRIVPLLVFLAAVIVLAELVGRAEVFDLVAGGIARTGRGSYGRLFVLCVLFASVTATVLNLDTTAVLLTPVMLAMAKRVGIAAVPLAMTTVWLANTASLLLPVSNLTNLLAADRVGLSAGGMAARMWAPQIAALTATTVCLWVFYWRRGRRGADAYVPPTTFRPADPVLFWTSATTCVAFLAAILLTPVPLWADALAAMSVVSVMFAVKRPGELTVVLVPWRLLAMVPGMFLVLETIDAHGMHRVLTWAVGAGGGAAALMRTAAAGAALSNALNNLPVYLAGEAAVPVNQHDQLLALLVGTNVGPLVSPWASLATLLWFERCRGQGVRIPLPRFIATGLVLAVTGTAAACGALILTG